MKTSRFTLPLFLALAVSTVDAFAADPTGRIPVGPETTPGDVGHLYKISQPGSYYLAANLVATPGLSGILINSGDVTLDLNGMAVIGDGTNNGKGIRVSFANGPVRIANGSVRNWRHGGIDVYSATVYFDSLDASDNGGNGFELNMGAKGLITACAAEENDGVGFYGTVAGEITFVNCRASRNAAGFMVAEANLRGCTAEHNNYGGFEAGHATLENCKAQNNGKNGINAWNSTIRQCVVVSSHEHGIRADRSIVQGCTVNYNGWQGILATGANVQDCTVRGNGFNGIHATDGRVESCTVYGNTNHGIVANGSTLITGNQVLAHAGNADAGILVVNGSNRIEDNNVTGNYYGIMVTGSVNFVARNSARSTFRNYWITTGNRVGAIVVPAMNNAVINGNSGGGSGTTDPWSNIAY